MEVGERYHVLELIGEGSFGRVYKGRRKFTKQVALGTGSLVSPETIFIKLYQIIFQIVALKFIAKLGKGANELRALEREISIMSKLRHENIISLYECIETDSEVRFGR